MQPRPFDRDVDIRRAGDPTDVDESLVELGLLPLSQGLTLNILVIDDDESVRSGLRWTLNSDYRVLEAAGRTEAMKLLRQETVDVVVSDAGAVGI